MLKETKNVFKLIYAVVRARRICHAIKVSINCISEALTNEFTSRKIIVEKQNDEFMSLFKQYEESNAKKRLNICCGSLLLEGYDNTDARQTDPSVIVFDHVKPWPLKSNSYDEVYARHCIEHFTKDEGQFLVSEMYRVLRPGGIVYITCPNLEYITWNINDSDPRKREILMSFYFGWQRQPFQQYDVHKWGYTEGTLRSLLISVGFTNVKNLTNNPVSREFKAKRWFGGLNKSGNTEHHLEVIGMKTRGG